MTHASEPAWPEKKLTDRQLDVLWALARIRDNPAHNSRNMTSEEWFAPEVRGYWAAPMDFGGTDGSHHSATATQLARMGLVDRYKNGRVNAFKSRNKGSCCYRISAAGLEYIAQLSKDTPA